MAEIFILWILSMIVLIGFAVGCGKCFKRDRTSFSPWSENSQNTGRIAVVDDGGFVGESASGWGAGCDGIGESGCSDQFGGGICD